MAINKVVYGNDTLIDLTEDTATADDVLNGKTFHLKNGLRATGNASMGIDMDLLWTNASPTSAFAPQTVSIDTNDYEMVLVSFRASTATGYDYYVSVLVPVKDVIFLAITTGNNRLRERKFTWTAGGLIFQNAYTYNSYASTPSVDNTVSVPYQIHGIN